MLATAVAYKGPAAVRIPRGEGLGVSMRKEFTLLPIGKGELLRSGKDVGIVAIGAMVDTAEKVADKLLAKGISAAVVNARFVKPLDEELILDTAEKCGRLIVLEEHSPHGGFGSAVLECLAAHEGSEIAVRLFALPDRFIHHGSRDLLLKEVGLDVPALTEEIGTWVKEQKAGGRNENRLQGA
jgi:1-deoxy-D-xylulose-5-phosphate synthase